MLFWKGLGIAVALIMGVCIVVVQFFLPAGTPFEDQFGYGLIAAGAFWWLIMKRMKGSENKLLASGNEEKIKKYKEAKEAKPEMYDLNLSSLLFIPVVYWDYILIGAGSLILLITLFLY